MTHRVLVVDDHQGWRRQIISILHDDRRWTVVGDASDGLEAVAKARSLMPDLVILDIGLPRLTGIEAARQILAFHPTCRILFLSEYRSSDIVAAAVATKACGYVVKSQAGDDLLPGLQAVIDGRQFLSAGLGAAVTPRPPAAHNGHCHEAAFCADETTLLDHYTRFVASALEAGSAALFVGANPRRHLIHQQLKARGLDVESAIAAGRYLSVDVADVLPGCMRDDRLDDALFVDAATALLRKAAGAGWGRRRVAACGEGAFTLLNEGRAAEAVRMERLMDTVARDRHINVFCGYLSTGSMAGSDPEVWRQIGAAHSVVHST